MTNCLSEFDTSEVAGLEGLEPADEFSACDGTLHICILEGNHEDEEEEMDHECSCGITWL